MNPLLVLFIGIVYGAGLAISFTQKCFNEAEVNNSIIVKDIIEIILWPLMLLSHLVKMAFGGKRK